MKNLTFFIAALLLAGSVVAISGPKKSYKSGLVLGTPEVKSINAMTFGPEGILMIGDSKSATVFAVETDDVAINDASDASMEGVDQKLAEALGTTVDNISIQDMAIHPLSKRVYISVHNGDGTPALLRINGDKLEAVSLTNVRYSQAAIDNPVDDKVDDRGRSQRVWAISDINYSNDKVMVTGLSNQEFSSTFRSIPFPYGKKQDQSSIEIWHAAHGKFETYSPIKTFTTALINGKEHLIASYTCTPLVLFPIDELAPGKHVKGRTVAELGSSNSPLDMVVMENKGKKFLLMANSNRAVMKIAIDDIDSFEGQLTDPVPGRYATEGVDFVNLPVTNVIQLDKMDESRFVVLQRKTNGSLDLWTGGERYL